MGNRVPSGVTVRKHEHTDAIYSVTDSYGGALIGTVAKVWRGSTFDWAAWTAEEEIGHRPSYGRRYGFATRFEAIRELRNAWRTGNPLYIRPAAEEVSA